MELRQDIDLDLRQEQILELLGKQEAKFIPKTDFTLFDPLTHSNFPDQIKLGLVIRAKYFLIGERPNGKLSKYWRLKTLDESELWSYTFQDNSTLLINDAELIARGMQYHTLCLKNGYNLGIDGFIAKIGRDGELIHKKIGEKTNFRILNALDQYL